MGLKIIGWFSNKNGIEQNNENKDIYLGSFNDMKKWLKNNSVDSIYFSDNNLSNNPSYSDLINFFGDILIPVYFVPVWDNFNINLHKENLGDINTLKLWARDYTVFMRLTKYFY